MLKDLWLVFVCLLIVSFFVLFWPSILLLSYIRRPAPSALSPLEVITSREGEEPETDSALSPLVEECQHGVSDKSWRSGGTRQQKTTKLKDPSNRMRLSSGWCCARPCRLSVLRNGRMHVVFLLIALSCLCFQLVAVGRYNDIGSMQQVPVSSSTSLFADDNLFPPERILERYIAWHGEEALRRQPENRTFSVAYYSCPHRIGNTIHAFFNAVLWAILTNRTVLWKYDGTEARNTVEDCDQFLERASWIPSFEHWSRNLSLPEPVPVKMNTAWNRKQARLLGQTPRFYSAAEQRASRDAVVVVFPRFRDMVPHGDLNTSRIIWNDDPRHLTNPHRCRT